MPQKRKSRQALTAELAETRQRLAEAEETLEAIRHGAVDALVVSGPEGNRCFTLESAETPYRLLIEQMTDGVATLTSEGIVLYCNRRFSVLFGFPLEQCMGALFSSLAIPEHQPYLAQLFRSTATGGHAHGEICTQSGGVTLCLKLSLASLPTSEMGAFYVVATDITETRKQESQLRQARNLLEQRVEERTCELNAAFEALQKSEARFRQMAETITDVFWMTSTDMQRILYVSPAYESVWGRKIGALYAHPSEWIDAILPEDRDRVVPIMSQLGIHSPQFHVEFRIVRPDGAVRWISNRGFQVINSEGRVCCNTGVAADITERKLALTALEESERKFMSLFRNHPGAIIVARLDDERIIDVNDSACRIFGFSREQAIGSTADEMGLWTNSNDRLHYKRLLEDYGRVTEFETTSRAPNGTRHLLVWAERISIGGEPAVVATSLDVTERRQMEAVAEQLRQRLLEASRRDGMAEVARNVLHNIGNMLNTLGVSTEIASSIVRNSKIYNLPRVIALMREHQADLARFLSEDPRGQQLPLYFSQLADDLLSDQSKLTDCLSALKTHVGHIEKIVAAQQRYTDLSGGNERVNVLEVIDEALAANAVHLKRHNVELIRNLEPVPILETNRYKVLLILVNLIKNAAIACGDSGRLDGRVEITLARNEREIQLAITDNGVGIPADHLTQLFTHGFSTRPTGHGFGLHSSALAAIDLGGALTAESPGPGQGATFKLTLPLCKSRHDS